MGSGLFCARRMGLERFHQQKRWFESGRGGIIFEGVHFVAREKLSVSAGLERGLGAS